MPENTFDIVSKVEMPEVVNAIQQTLKEIQTRFDLKDSKSTIELNEKEHKLTLASKDEFKTSEKGRILSALQACDWNRVQAARMLGLPRRTFYRRLKEYGIL